MNGNYESLRITKLRDYLIKVVNDISKLKSINVNALSKEINTYSLDKLPTESTVEVWVNGTEIHRDVYTFSSRRNYSYNEINNLLNIGFFEIFEEAIKDNNKKGILPEIEGIENIQCLNCGTMVNNETNTAEFDIQIEIRYVIE